MALAANYPLRPDKGKIEALIIGTISSASDFALVYEHEGTIRAVLLAFVGNNLWAERKFANVVLWWSDMPGKGVVLLRQFKLWVTSRRVVRIAGFSPDINLDQRVYTLFTLLGFEKIGGNHIFVNGVNHGNF